jgi:peptidyl-prolyl cis-trans isomerase D
MLQTIRDKITGVVAILFLGAIGIVFVFWGIDFQTAAASYAAKVDGQRIPVETVRRAWQQRQSQLQRALQNELPPDMAKQQQTMLLDRFVRQVLLQQRAEDFGYRVSDEALAARVMQVPQFQVDGKFSKDRYNALLASSGMSQTQFEADLQSEILIEQLQTAIADSTFVPQYELDRRYALEKQEREIDYALISPNEFSAGITITDEQIQKWYDENKSSYLTTETVDLQYVELTRAQAESGVTVTEADLKDYYESVQAQFESAERRQGRHILITAGEGVDDAAAKRKAEELTAKAQAGADFAQLAKENSKDPGSAPQGGDLGWAERGMFVGPFEEALFAMKPGEIRGPVKTQFGYHVLKLEQIEPGRRKTFEEARADVDAEYRKNRAQTVFYDASQKLAESAFASLTELDSVAKQMNLPLRTVSGFTREGGGELGQDPGAIEAAFSEDVLERRQNSPLVAIGEDRAVVLRVTDHKPAEPRPLSEVREQIAAQLKARAEQEAATKKGADALARLKKGEPWSEVAKALALQPVGKRFVTRDDKVAPSNVIAGAFSAAKNEISAEKPYYSGVATDDGNYAVYAVTQVRNADPAAERQNDLADRRRQAERKVGIEEMAAYVTEAERNADIVKNEKVFE